MTCSYSCYWSRKDGQRGRCRCRDPACLMTKTSSEESSVGPVVYSSLHTDILYLSLSCSLCCTLFKIDGVVSVSSLVEVFTTAFFVSDRCSSSSSSSSVSFFLSSVHIGGPQNAVCSLAGYLFLLMSVIVDEYADVLISGYVLYTLCWDIGAYADSRCICVYVQFKNPQPTEIASSLTLDPNVPLSLCITYIDILNTHTHTQKYTEIHTDTHTEIHAYCTGSNMCHD